MVASRLSIRSSLKTAATYTAFQLGRDTLDHEIWNQSRHSAFECGGVYRENPGPLFMHGCDAYRVNAEACAKLADKVADPRTKVVLLAMAEAWLRLAEYVERRERSKSDYSVWKKIGSIPRSN